MDVQKLPTLRSAELFGFCNGEEEGANQHNGTEERKTGNECAMEPMKLTCVDHSEKHIFLVITVSLH